MKFNWVGLIVWYFIFDFINDPLRELLLKGKADVFYMFDDFQSFMVFLSGHFSFFFFGVISYAGLYFYYRKKKYVLCFIFIILSFILPIVIRYFIQEFAMYELFGFSNYRRGVELKYYFVDNLYFAFRYVTFGIVYFFIQLTIIKDRKEKELIIANQRMELSMLRSQINPHFLLNSLNNIYALIYHKSMNALPAMDKLTEILKYSLYENKENVSIEEEIKIVDSVIELNRLRHDYEIPIQKDIDDQLLERKIPPFIIVPLVENAFKHGDLKDTKMPLEISIKRIDSNINIKVKNKKGRHEKDEVGGIGLENIKKRLELIFEKQHEFNITEDMASFEVNITIPIV